MTRGGRASPKRCGGGLIRWCCSNEIEKSPSPTSSTCCWQVLDDGRLTDGQGRTVDFPQHVDHHDLESRFGISWSTSPEGEDTSAVAAKQVMGMGARRIFRPEFLNRVDEIILFHRLAERARMGRIVEIQFSRLQRLLEDRKITLPRWIAAARELGLRPKGWDPAYGARPLKAGDPAQTCRIRWPR